MRILVVDDEPNLRRAFARRLRNEGHVVDELGTLADARTAIATVAYDGLVLDRMLPDGDSLTLVSDIRRQAGTIAVLVVSAWGSPEDRIAGLRAGADEYRAKPIRLDELARTVDAVLRRTDADRAAPADPPPAPPARPRRRFGSRAVRSR